MTPDEYEKLSPEEKEHFYQCSCGGFVDERELRDVIFHESDHNRQMLALPIINSADHREREKAWTASDLSNRRCYFELTTTPNVIWVDLHKFDLKAGSPVMILDPGNIDLAGNVSAKFQKTKKNAVLGAISKA